MSREWMGHRPVPGSTGTSIIDSRTRMSITIEGHALLNAAALTAARHWRFVQGTNPADPFEVRLRFKLRCPAR
jgi:hypothetical protein